MNDDTSNIIQKIKENIEYQIEKIDFFWTERIKTTEKIITELANKEKHNSKNKIANQAFTDAVINSMASLIDYYYMYCFMKMGLNVKNITDIQYKPINNSKIKSSSPLKKDRDSDPTMEFIIEQFDKKITELCKLELSSIGKLHLHDYWHAFFGEAISASLFEAGILREKSFKIDYKSDDFEINNLVKKYHYYMEAFYCNERHNNGAKYNIYVGINNCLKHNIVPYVQAKIVSFEEEKRGFLYFTFKKEDSIFLKKGLLKTIVDLDFDELSDILKKSYQGEISTHADADVRFVINNLLTFDKINGYTSQDKKSIHFFIDNVLIEKNKDVTFVDANGSLKTTLQFLIGDIRRGMELDLSEFD